MSFQGSLQDFPLPRLLEIMAEGGRSGALVLEFPAGQGRGAGQAKKATLYFQQGALVQVERQGEERPGLVQLLIDRGLISSDRVEKILTPAYIASDKELALLFLEAGVVSRDEITEVVEEQIGMMLSALLIAREGRFKLQTNLRPPVGLLTVNIPIEQVLLRGKRGFRSGGG